MGVLTLLPSTAGKQCTPVAMPGTVLALVLGEPWAPRIVKRLGLLAARCR
ncbi:MAG: hypothetical protein WC621_03825 [Patescibacteria group bacterium]